MTAEPEKTVPQKKTKNTGKDPSQAGSATASPSTSYDYLGDGSASVLPKLKEKFPHGVKALEVGMYPTYVFVNVQDPGKKNHVDRYSLREGQWQEPEPVELDEDEAGAIQAAAFDPSEVLLAEVPKITKDALSRLNVENATVSHVLIRRLLPFEKEVRMRVFVTGARSERWADYDRQGKFLKAGD